MLNEYLIESIDYKGCTIKIFSDDDPINPREDYDNLGKMFCAHKKYTLGDKSINELIDTDDFNGWDEIQKHLIKELGAVIILPLYLYDHSGITISTGQFSCAWDSGQIGFIYATKEDILNWYGKKRISKQVKEWAAKHLENEVNLYDKYLRGDVVRFEVEDKDGENIDSCSGFYEIKEAIINAKDSIWGNIRDKQVKNNQKIKAYIKNHVPLNKRILIN